MIQALDAIGINYLQHNDITLPDFQCVNEFCNNEKYFKPVVIEIKNLDPLYLFTLDGRPLDEMQRLPNDFRYTKQIALNLSNAYYLNETNTQEQ